MRAVILISVFVSVAVLVGVIVTLTLFIKRNILVIGFRSLTKKNSTVTKQTHSSQVARYKIYCIIASTIIFE